MVGASSIAPKVAGYLTLQMSCCLSGVKAINAFYGNGPWTAMSKTTKASLSLMVSNCGHGQTHAIGRLPVARLRQLARV